MEKKLWKIEESKMKQKEQCNLSLDNDLKILKDFKFLIAQDIKKRMNINPKKFPESFTFKST